MSYIQNIQQRISPGTQVLPFPKKKTKRELAREERAKKKQELAFQRQQMKLNKAKEAVERKKQDLAVQMKQKKVEKDKKDKEKKKPKEASSLRRDDFVVCDLQRLWISAGGK